MQSYKAPSVRLFHLMAYAASCLFTVSCASLNPAPFSQFSASVKSAQDQMGNAMDLTEAATKAAVIARVSSNPAGKLSDFHLQPGKQYDWNYKEDNPPVFLKLEKKRSTLEQFNGLFSRYVNLLLSLADSDLKDPNAFDQMAKDMNANASALVTDATGTAPKEELALLSSAVTKVFESFISSKRKGDLKSALAANQPAVDSYTETCITLIQDLRDFVKSSYNDGFTSFDVQWNSYRGRSGPTDIAGRANVLNQAFALNQQFTSSLAILQDVEAQYHAIAAAHKELTHALDGSSGIVAILRQMATSGQQIQRRYSELKEQQ